LIQDNDGIHALGVQDPSQNVSLLLRNFADDFSLAKTEICGYVLKSRSPSCGIGTTPFYDRSGNLKGQTDGLFAHTILVGQPTLPIVDEEQLLVDSVFEKFLKNAANVFAHRTSSIKKGETNE